MFGHHVNNKLSEYCNDELQAAEARQVAEHLLHCHRCRKEYEEIKLGAQMAAHLLPAKAPASLWGEIEMMLDQDKAVPTRFRGFDKKQQKPFSSLPFFKFAVVGLALLLLAGIGAWRRWQDEQADDRQNYPNKPSWAVARLAGQPKIDEQQIGESGKLAVGEWLVTDGSSRAQISVGEIGEVQVEPNSRIRLVQAQEEEHRLALARGKMHAFIWAPPKQFYVDTPSAVAVDLGCSYTLEVNDEGRGLLHVTSGWVAFEWKGRESFVPAEAECITRPGPGPGTPYFKDASIAFKESLSSLDSLKPDDGARADALAVVLAQSRKRDALTLWHLLSRTDEVECGRVYDRLSKLIPPPPAVTRAGVIRGDRTMRDLWWDKLELGNTDWWRMWKGPLPSQPK
jgi:hypothetical protein